MTTPQEPSPGHDVAIRRVRDAHGYDAGYAATCATHDWSGDLRERQSQALSDYWRHIDDTRESDTHHGR